jgi:acyl transferase domain-containing protein/phosphopantetheinyl transferase
MARRDPPPAPEPVAIIGMACIFPQAPDLRSFWNNILGGVDAVGEPVPRWDARRYLDAGRIRTARGGYLGDLYRFDPREFGIMPNSVEGGEPDQFLALRVARDALADAGWLGPGVDHRDTGVILGHSTYLHRGQVSVVQNHLVLDQTIELLRAALPHLGAAELDVLRRRLAAHFTPVSPDNSPGLVPNVMTGRIANRLDLHGPNYLVDAACSSSLLAVGAAIDELRAGRSRMMIAGGVNASLPADVATIFTQLGALSARGKVRPFEAGSDGTLLGEGLGMVVLKRLSDALADGDRVYACIRGIGQASDGRGTGLLAPSVDGETLAIRRAYEGCGVDPSSVGLVEAHGTGIPLGDRTEIAALANVFGARRGEVGHIAVGSVKSMISHCIPAAGVAGLIKTALALHHKVLPPTLCEQVNPELGIDRTPLYVNTEARPWISAPDRPRRAGVDSFGFGGINTHAVVEEAPPAAVAPARLADWPFEMCRWSAPDAETLARRLESFVAALARAPQWRLAEIAAALARADRGEACRLAIVARSVEALAKSVQAALPRLRETPVRDHWSTRGGAFFSRVPLEGRLAFVFPGEGSQYPGMLADVALHLDEARAWLDFWHDLYDDAPGSRRTDIVYPPASDLTPERRRQFESRLHDMDVGSEAVMVGGQAMHAVLRAFGVEPDAMLGHSSGESSALAASGALPSDRVQLAGFIRELNAVYQRVLAEGKIPTGALLAVGALPASMVHEKVAASGLALDVAMDNCDNQLVLYGARADVDRMQALLAAEGGICLPLPFDRGYHTPAFADVSRAFHDYYRAIRLGVPKVPLYSCASAAPFPGTPAAARKLAAAQWSQTVRFRETVLRMVADGVRSFVEVGPSANLTAFIDDVLTDVPHLALPTNQRRRHGMEQLLATLAQLWVRRRPMSLERLFAGRAIGVIALDAPAPAAPPRGIVLDNTMPTLRLSDADRAWLGTLAAPAPARAEAQAAEGSGYAAGAGAPPAPEASIAASESAMVQADRPAASTATGALVPPEGEVGVVMQAHFGLMQQFLCAQEGLLARLAPGFGVPAPADAPAHEAPALPTPFIDAVLEHDGGRLVAECLLDVQRDAFLRDHVLSGPVSAADSGLSGLACVPLMVSMEMLAEAAALLLGRADVSAIEQVRTFDWIALDHGSRRVELRATAAGDATADVELVQGDAVAVRARVRFGAAPGGTPALQALDMPRPARWNGAGIYDVGMFHGPLFQSIEHIEGWGAGGIDARIAPTPELGFFAPGEPAAMILDPVLLDAVGQLAACWIAEHVGTDFNCFPSSIERIDVLRTGAAGQAGAVLRGRVLPPGGPGADPSIPRAWDFDAVDDAGQPLVRVRGLVNVFFPVPHRFYQVRRDPLGGWLGAPLPDAPEGTRLWWLEMLDEAFCAQSSGVFLRILAHATLSAAERAQWLALEAPLRRRREWLLGRLAIKEAVRAWVLETTGTALHPADVEVLHDERGAPLVDGWWTAGVSAAPAVSLAHDAHACLAAVAPPGGRVGVDLEAIDRVQRPQWLAHGLAPSEQAFLATLDAGARDEVALRMWCAKEAAAKWRGTGLEGRPDAYEVSFLSADCEHAMVRCGDTMIETHVEVRRVGSSLIAVAARELHDSRVPS